MNVPTTIPYAGQKFGFVGVAGHQINYRSGPLELTTRLGQIMRTGPAYAMLRYAGEPATQPWRRAEHPPGVEHQPTGNLVLAFADSYVPIDNRVAAALGGFAVLGRSLGVDPFGNAERRLDIVWDASVAWLFGDLTHVTLQLFSNDVIIHKVKAPLDERVQRRDWPTTRPVDRADISIGGMADVVKYRSWLRGAWHVPPREKVRPGRWVTTRSGTHYVAFEDLHCGRVQDVNGSPWLEITDEQLAATVGLHRNHAPEDVCSGQRLAYFVEKHGDRLIAIDPIPA